MTADGRHSAQLLAQVSFLSSLRRSYELNVATHGKTVLEARLKYTHVCVHVLVCVCEKERLLFIKSRGSEDPDGVWPQTQRGRGGRGQTGV